MTERETRLQTFVDWCAAHISGDEKGEAQLFLDHLFRAFGHGGLKEAGGFHGKGFVKILMSMSHRAI